MFNHEHICLNYCYCSWVRIEQEETDQIREETRQRKSDSCSSINHFHSSILHSTTEHTSKLCYIHFPFILPPLCILKPASPTHAYFLLLYLCLLVALAPQMLCILLVCRKRRKGCIICTVQRDRQKAKLQGRQQLAMPILSANPFWEKAACTYNSTICHAFLMPLAMQPHSYLPT